MHVFVFFRRSEEKYIGHKSLRRRRRQVKLETESESVKTPHSPLIPDYDDGGINIGQDMITEYFEEATLASSGESESAPSGTIA